MLTTKSSFFGAVLYLSSRGIIDVRFGNKFVYNDKTYHFGDHLGIYYHDKATDEVVEVVSLLEDKTELLRRNMSCSIVRS